MHQAQRERRPESLRRIEIKWVRYRRLQAMQTVVRNRASDFSCQPHGPGALPIERWGGSDFQGCASPGVEKLLRVLKDALNEHFKMKMSPR